MSTINVTNLSGRGGATPNLPDGANITGVATATSFDGNLKSTGTPTLGLGVTINSSGLAISGVATAGIISATTLYGDGSNLTGVGETIAPWHYNPKVSAINSRVSTGIGVTFNKKVVAGSGTATIKIVNAGVAGTTIQSWGISSVTFGVTDITFGALVSNLTINKTYQVDIPATFIDDTTGASYVGTAWTFTAQDATGKLFTWGYNSDGYLGHNNEQALSSPTQVPGTTWDVGTLVGQGGYSGAKTMSMLKTDGTLWVWGANDQGALGVPSISHGVHRSSPIQVGTDTTWSQVSYGIKSASAIKTDGTLWSWGFNEKGQLGLNNVTSYSSPVQLPGTNWAFVARGSNSLAAIKTDGTLYTCGKNEDHGQNAHNNIINYSSPTQVPGTTWRKWEFDYNRGAIATKTDGTLWSMGYNGVGQLGQNNLTSYSSPVQIPGTNWSESSIMHRMATHATKTDGTLWAWGYNNHGQLGLNNVTSYSSPIQIPGTTWGTEAGKMGSGTYAPIAVKTDGTLWIWGYNNQGQLGLSQNEPTKISSPIQIGSETDWVQANGLYNANMALLKDTTPDD